MRYILIFIFTIITFSVSAQRKYIYDDYPEKKSFPIQLRTNGLYWCTLFPNIGIEAQTNYGLAFQLDYIGAWWNKNRTHHYYSGYAFQFETRYYINNILTKSGDNDNNAENKALFMGFHAGIYLQMISFDFEFGGKGYMCNDLSKTIGVGVSGGYCMPLNENFSLDFTLGIGWVTSDYKEYIPHGEYYVKTDDRKKNFFGPTKAEVSLAWNINNKTKE